jgi:hypothetical protein
LEDSRLVEERRSGMATQVKPNYVEELVKLEELREHGALTDEEFARAKAGVLEEMTMPAAPAEAQTTDVTVPGEQPKDVVGAGRYILSFLLLGVIGLGIAYVLRERGWLPIWINGGLAALVWIVILSG